MSKTYKYCQYTVCIKFIVDTLKPFTKWVTQPSAMISICTEPLLPEWRGCPAACFKNWSSKGGKAQSVSIYGK